MSGLAEATIRAARYCPGKTLLTNAGLGWTSLRVNFTECAASIDPFETLATPDPRMVLFLNKTAFIQHFSQGRWRGLPEVHSTRELPPARRRSK